MIAAGSEIITIGRSKLRNLTLKLSPYFSRHSCMKGSGRKLQRSVWTRGELFGSGGRVTAGRIADWLRSQSEGSVQPRRAPSLASAPMPPVADLKLHSSGKVREIYEWEDDLLMVASDRISIYDVVMPTPITDKGKVLNRISEFWFELTGDIVPNHFLSADVPEEVTERAMRVRRLEMYPVECVVRGYLSGSGWKEYKSGGAVCGIELPPNLLESDKLPEPIFTPATKAEIGDHDENVDFERAAEIVGDRALMEELRRISIEVYTARRRTRGRARDHPRRHQVRVRPPRRRRDRPRRRGADAGLLALLAGRPLPAGQHAALLRQAVRARLGRRGGLGPQAAGAGAAARRGRADAGQVRRGLRADHGALLLVAKARVLIRPKEGILDPQGKAVERALPALGFEGIEHVRVGRMVELEAEDPARLAELCEKLLANPLIEDYEIESLDGAVMRWGVLQFPGSCDERDALHACELSGGEARLVWHEERDLDGIDAVVVPGGFSYGDYLRAGAIARFSPAMEAVAEFAAAGGPVLGICNGFQVLCEAGLLPGALLLNESLRFICRQVELHRRRASRAGHIDRSRPVGDAVDPGQARRRAVLGAGGDARRARGERAGRLPLRAGAEPERVGARHRRGAQRGRQRARPDAPPRARGRPADRVDRRPAGLRGRRRGRGARA